MPSPSPRPDASPKTSRDNAPPARHPLVDRHREAVAHYARGEYESVVAMMAASPDEIGEA